MTYSKHLGKYLILFGALLLCFRAFQNHYPLVYPDTGTYIESGFTGNVPNDRPIIYGLFTRHISLSVTLWLVVFAQSLIVSALMYLCLKYFTKIRKPYRLFLSVIVILVIGTGVSVNASQLIPDIFTSVCWLSLALLLLAHSIKKVGVVIISLIFVIASMMHNTHLIVSLLTVVGFSIYMYVCRKNFKEKFDVLKKRILLCWCLSLSVWVLLPSIHYLHGFGFHTTKGSHVFFVSKLIQIGMLDKYLAEYCGERNYNLCDYQGQYDHNFLWDYEKSPLYLTGGRDANKEEYNRLIKDMLLTPKYLKMFIQKSIQFTLKQLFSFHTGDTPPQTEGSSPHAAIKNLFPDELLEYEMTHQQRNWLDWTLLNYTQNWFILLSTLALFLLLLSPNLQLPANYRQLTALLFLFLLANAFVCGTLSDTTARFQSRIIWLIPFVAAIGLTLAYPQWKDKEKTQTQSPT